MFPAAKASPLPALHPLRVFIGWLAEVAYVVFLFIKSDILHIIIALPLFSLANAPQMTTFHVLQIITWAFIHVLQFNISNQHLPDSITEDRINKPYRPIASGRVTHSRAKLFRWAAVPACLLWSSLYGGALLLMSIAFMGFTLAYNEFGFGRYAIAREFLNGIGCMMLCTAATLIALPPPERMIQWAIVSSMIISTGAHATTIYAQDFRDIEGDKHVGRCTVPIKYPQEVTRPLLMAFMVGWSLALAKRWSLGLVGSSVYIALAAFVGTRFVLLRDSRSDKVSYEIYCLWLVTSYALPTYYRLSIASA